MLHRRGIVIAITILLCILTVAGTAAAGERPRKVGPLAGLSVLIDPGPTAEATSEVAYHLIDWLKALGADVLLPQEDSAREAQIQLGLTQEGDAKGISTLYVLGGDGEVIASLIQQYLVEETGAYGRGLRVIEGPGASERSHVAVEADYYRITDAEAVARGMVFGLLDATGHAAVAEFLAGRRAEPPASGARKSTTSEVGKAANPPAPKTPEAPSQPTSDDKTFMAYWAKWGGDPDPLSSFRRGAERIDILAPYWYTVLGDGSLRARETGRAALTAEAHDKGIKVMPLINKTGSSDAMLTDPKIRARAIENIYRMVKENGYDGVNIDFERLKPYLRPYLTAFMRELHARLSPEGLVVTMAVMPKWSENESTNDVAIAFDYDNLAKYVDKMVIMTYDRHGKWSGPGPVAPVDWVEQVVQYTVRHVPREKVLLGLAGYGYDWSKAGTRSIKAHEAMALAWRIGAEIHWDAGAGVPHFTYWDWAGKHEVWFENSYSVELKLKLVDKYGLGGYALWSLGQEDERFWSVIK